MCFYTELSKFHIFIYAIDLHFYSKSRYAVEVKSDIDFVNENLQNI